MYADLNGKRILFFSPAFFKYENMIADKMRAMGAYVDMYDVRSVTGAFQRALLKFSPSFFSGHSKKYYENIIEQNRETEYDYILIVKCDMTPISILEKFRSVYPNAKLCLYLWDSVDNIPGIKKKFQYFDTLHSFDYNDCQKYPVLKFRPLFYGDQFRREKLNIDYKYDISFLGTIHSDRYAVIRKIQNIANNLSLNCFWFLYLQSDFIFWVYKFIKKEFRHTKKTDFCFDKLPVSDIAKIVDESRCVLDIQHPKQTGLTMRTIEMVGMKKKIITTNTNIRNYDFYNENNISVIDRESVEVDMDFFTRPYQEIDNEIYEDYSLSSWIKTVLT